MSNAQAFLAKFVEFIFKIFGCNWFCIQCVSAAHSGVRTIKALSYGLGVFDLFLAFLSFFLCDFCFYGLIICVKSINDANCIGFALQIYGIYFKKANKRKKK